LSGYHHLNLDELVFYTFYNSELKASEAEPLLFPIN